MDRKCLKWSLIATYIFMVPAILAVVIYLLTPAYISAQSGVPSSVCQESAIPGSGPSSNLYTAMSRLCSEIQAFLGVSAMILIVLGFIPAFISNVIATVEIASSKMENAKKALWMILFWLILSFIGVTLYYFTDRKKGLA